jgi:hypothetical protein
MKLGLFLQLKKLNIKVDKNSSIGNRFVECGRTDRQDEGNDCFFPILLMRLK